MWIIFMANLSRNQLNYFISWNLRALLCWLLFVRKTFTSEIILLCCKNISVVFWHFLSLNLCSKSTWNGDARNLNFFACTDENNMSIHFLFNRSIFSEMIIMINDITTGLAMKHGKKLCLLIICEFLTWRRHDKLRVLFSIVYKWVDYAYAAVFRLICLPTCILSVMHARSQ